MGFKCKRIIDGKTYNTETATQLTGWDENEGGPESGMHLYQTRFGAFFVFSYFEWNGEDDWEKIEPLTADQAREWIEKHQPYKADLIERLFGEMPEAGSGESKFTLRMPDSLRDRLAARAKSIDRSLNAYIVSCLEYVEQRAEEFDGGTSKDIPPMGNMVGSNRLGWRTKGSQP